MVHFIIIENETEFLKIYILPKVVLENDYRYFIPNIILQDKKGSGAFGYKRQHRAKFCVIILH